MAGAGMITASSAACEGATLNAVIATAPRTATQSEKRLSWLRDMVGFLFDTCWLRLQVGFDYRLASIQSASTELRPGGSIDRTDGGGSQTSHPVRVFRIRDDTESGPFCYHRMHTSS